MFKNRYPFANPTEAKKYIFKSLFKGVCLPVHADEGDPASGGGEGTPTPAPSTLNLEEVIARVRKEEKDKLYGRITKLEGENKTLRESVNNYIMQIAEYQTRLEEAQKKGDDAEQVEQLNGQIQALTQELETLRSSTPNEEAIREQVKAEYEVKFYAEKQKSENTDKILPVFMDTVTGATKEEVDAAIASAVEKSTQVKKDLGLVDEEGNPIDTSKKKKPAEKQTKGKPTTPPVSTPPAQEEPTFDIEYVRGLDPRSKEYAEFRQKMGLR